MHTIVQSLNPAGTDTEKIRCIPYGVWHPARAWHRHSCACLTARHGQEMVRFRQWFGQNLATILPKPDCDPPRTRPRSSRNPTVIGPWSNRNPTVIRSKLGRDPARTHPRSGQTLTPAGPRPYSAQFEAEIQPIYGQNLANLRLSVVAALTTIIQSDSDWITIKLWSNYGQNLTNLRPLVPRPLVATNRPDSG